jgi:hypothetical protein
MRSLTLRRGAALNRHQRDEAPGAVTSARLVDRSVEEAVLAPVKAMERTVTRPRRPTPDALGLRLLRIDRDDDVVDRDGVGGSREPVSPAWPCLRIEQRGAHERRERLREHRRRCTRRVGERLAGDEHAVACARNLEGGSKPVVGGAGEAKPHGAIS